MTETNDAADVADMISAIGDASLREDCLALVESMTAAGGLGPRLWGPTLVGFGEVHYRYASGREGDVVKIGFTFLGVTNPNPRPI